MIVKENAIALAGASATVDVRNNTYVMRGASETKSLETYHLIMAPSYECNLRCKHCYLPDHDTRKLSLNDVLRLASEWSEIVVAERGPMGGIFHLKGGEPLVLPYLNDVLGRLAELKTLRFMMTTNGAVGNWNIVERLDELNTALDGGVQTTVSIDGSNDEINAKLRGQGNFDKAVGFVRQLRDTGVTVFLNNVIHKGNLDDIQAFVDLAMELDVAQVNFLSFVPKGYGEEMRFGRPDPADVFERVQKIWESSDECVRNLLAGSLSDILHAESCGSCTSNECVGGYRGLLYIVPDGTAYSCPNLNHSGLEAGNIHERPLGVIHNAIAEKIYFKVATLEGGTKDRYLCKGEKRIENSVTYTKSNNAAIQEVGSRNSSKHGTSYCFSRNF